MKNVHALRTRRIGPHLFVDVHIQVDAALSVAAGHLIAHRGQDAVLSMVDEVSEVIVHVEPDVPIPFPDSGVPEESLPGTAGRS